ncbi:MAG: hypothetical protein HYZ26_10825 [Chloroflexi bacterium]|nr:hypothetical protein [Chloroflexota bacterium]
MDEQSTVFLLARQSAGTQTTLFWGNRLTEEMQIGAKTYAYDTANPLGDAPGEVITGAPTAACSWNSFPTRAGFQACVLARRGSRHLTQMENVSIKSCMPPLPYP